MDEDKRGPDVPAEEEEKKGWKEKIFSERFMNWVNVLFVLILILRMPAVTIAAYALWLAYLGCGFVLTKNLTMRIAYGILAAVAIAGIVLSIRAL